jgi:hypothetical protein
MEVTSANRINREEARNTAARPDLQWNEYLQKEKSITLLLIYNQCHGLWLKRASTALTLCTAWLAEGEEGAFSAALKICLNKNVSCAFIITLKTIFCNHLKQKSMLRYFKEPISQYVLSSVITHTQ